MSLTMKQTAPSTTVSNLTGEPGIPREKIRLSEVISALSYALDITEGQPEGHAIRSCVIGISIARKLGLSNDRQAALFHALLLKDLGCSSNAAKMCWLFQADDRTVKRDIKLVDWTSLLKTAAFSFRQVKPGAWLPSRLLQVLGLSLKKDEAGRELIKMRCERGADITKMLGFPDITSQAILDLDEHWNGGGHPMGLAGEDISLEGRICSLAQTTEVFLQKFDLATACQVAKKRSGTWFDPELVNTFVSLAKDKQFVADMNTTDLNQRLMDLEPADQIQAVDDHMLNRVALAFSKVIDAKSPWTLRHSEGVSEIAVGIANTLGMDDESQNEIRRAGLLHDIGKLGVSNLILDKPGKLTDSEFDDMRSHSMHSQKILERVTSFRRFADYASAHHERLDGKGYHRGLKAGQIPMEARILAVADVCEALTAKRPYRDGMPAEKVMSIISGDAGSAFCPVVVDAFLEFQNQSHLFDRLAARDAD